MTATKPRKPRKVASTADDDAATRRAAKRARWDELAARGITIGSVVVLTADVTHPESAIDRRTSGWKRHQGVTPAGTRYVVVDIGCDGVVVPELCRRVPRHGDQGSGVAVGSDLFDAMMPALEVAPPTGTTCSPTQAPPPTSPTTCSSC